LAFAIGFCVVVLDIGAVGLLMRVFDGIAKLFLVIFITFGAGLRLWLLFLLWRALFILFGGFSLSLCRILGTLEVVN
jgi:hypothetical protein